MQTTFVFVREIERRIKGLQHRAHDRGNKFSIGLHDDLDWTELTLEADCSAEVRVKKRDGVVNGGHVLHREILV